MLYLQKLNYFAMNLRRYNSSNVFSADYDKREHTLYMVFVNRKNWLYVYYNVPPRVWTLFIRAESKGKYFDGYIRNQFSYSVNKNFK